MLRVIINYCETQNLYPYPTTILCDFELAVVRAVEQVLGQHVVIQGCFYHFTQATWRKIQDLQLSRSYKTDVDFRQLCTKLDAMAFLSVTNAPEALASLGDNAHYGTEGLVEYFSTNCLDGTFRSSNHRWRWRDIHQHAPFETANKTQTLIRFLFVFLTMMSRTAQLALWIKSNETEP